MFTVNPEGAGQSGFNFGLPFQRETEPTPAVQDAPRLFIPSCLSKGTGVYKPLCEVSAGDIQTMRQSLLALMPLDLDPALMQLAIEVLADDTLVTSYFCPKVLEILPSANRFTATADTPFWIPAVQLARAITKAHLRSLSHAVSPSFSQALLQLARQEWPLTALAILLEPCGMFYSASFRAMAELPCLPMGSEPFDVGRFLLLDRPVRNLRQQYPGIAAALAAVWGLSSREDYAGHGEGDEFSAQQAARVGASVWLATLRVKGLWAPPECLNQVAPRKTSKGKKS